MVSLRYLIPCLQGRRRRFFSKDCWGGASFWDMIFSYKHRISDCTFSRKQRLMKEAGWNQYFKTCIKRYLAGTVTSSFNFPNKPQSKQQQLCFWIPDKRVPQPQSHRLILNVVTMDSIPHYIPCPHEPSSDIGISNDWSVCLCVCTIFVDFIN